MGFACIILQTCFYMPLLQPRNPEQFIRRLTIATLTFIICCGFVLVLAQIKPFWVDEWRVIYNLKYKNAVQLFGPLDFMQQFPRVYLEIIKAFSAPFDYSYFTLRLPSFLVGTATIIFCYRLMKKIYAPTNLNRFLFVMILISSYTFTEYFVQIKQYTMDILVSLVALAQLIELHNPYSKNLNKRRYLLLCVSFFIVPFFSYIYPIAFAPVFIITALKHISLIKASGFSQNRKIIILQWIPLIICTISIFVFYVIDVSQLMADKGMHQFWGERMMKGGFSLKMFFKDGYQLFAEVGRGLLFSIIFGILGVVSFAFGIKKCVRNFSFKMNNNNLLILYSVLLLVIVFILFIAGKFPLGEPRLNVFTVPSIAILIISLLDELTDKMPALKLAKIIPVILYLGVIGNIYTTFIKGVTGSVYTRKLDIYVSTENAIILAQSQKLPIFITPEVAYPYDKTRNLPYLNTVPGDWVLKTFPAYKVAENIPVYNIASLSELKENLRQLPANITSVLAGDGRSFRIINRDE